MWPRKIYTWVMLSKRFNWEKCCLHGSTQRSTCNQHLRPSFWRLKKTIMCGLECKGRHKAKAWTLHCSISIWPTSCRARHLLRCGQIFSVPGIKCKQPQGVSNPQFILLGSLLSRREQLRKAHRCISLKEQKQKSSWATIAVLDKGSIITTHS